MICERLSCPLLIVISVNTSLPFDGANPLRLRKAGNVIVCLKQIEVEGTSNESQRILKSLFPFVQRQIVYDNFNLSQYFAPREQEQASEGVFFKKRDANQHFDH